MLTYKQELQRARPCCLIRLVFCIAKPEIIPLVAQSSRRLIDHKWLARVIGFLIHFYQYQLVRMLVHFNIDHCYYMQ